MGFRKWLGLLVMGLALAAGLALGYRQILPPPLPAQAEEAPITLAEAAQGPDMQMMLSHIRAMAQEPHHVDSMGLRRTQDYLKKQLTQMGFAYEEESYQLSIPDILAIDQHRIDHGSMDFGVTPQSIREGGDMGTRDHMGINNIIVTVDAPQSEEAVLFVAHTDSVKYGPGAFDDIVSVAAMLEGLRQLQGVIPLRDMVFLFADGEEQGLLGAAKYVENHPDMAARTRLVVNLEARGNRGGLIMFETSPNNLEAVRTFARSAHHPIGFSFAAAVYRIMKNDTVLSMFMAAGYPGLNFAVVDGVEVYHTEEDNYQTFDRASAYHYLRTVSSLVQHFSTQETLHIKADQDAVFFPLLPGQLVVMPQSLSNTLGILTFLLFSAFLVWTLQQGQAAWRPMLLAAGKQLLLIGLSAGLSLLITKLINDAQSMEDFLHMLRSGMDWLYFLLLLAVYCVLAVLLYKRSPQEGTALSTALGVLLVPALLIVCTVLLFPSASYLFWLPVLMALMVLPAKPAHHTGIPQGLLIGLILLLYVPVVCLVFIALGLTNAHLSLGMAMIPLTIILASDLLWKESQAKDSAAVH